MLAITGVFFLCCSTALANPGNYGWGSNSRTTSKPATATTAHPATATPGIKTESRTVDALYKAALAEGGKLVVYAGGDAPNQQDDNKKGFEAAFPGMTVEIVVDFSKNHDARIDYQLANNKVVVDFTQLQTLHDFPKWKKEGALLNYKPIGWEHIYNEFKDAEGAYTGVVMVAFTNNINTDLLPNNATWPIEARDYLRPEFKSKLAVTWPNDDDAVLFWFKQVVDKYGFSYLEQFIAQNPALVRGTATASDLVRNGTFVATMTAGGSIRYNTGVSRFVLPKVDPFVVWPQTVAILKKAPHPEAAKLYLNWLLNKTEQEKLFSWSVRDDVSVPTPYKSIWSYPNGDPLAFGKFMADRAAVESFKTQVGLIFGQPTGGNPNTPNGEVLGMYPVKAVPHTS